MVLSGVTMVLRYYITNIKKNYKRGGSSTDSPDWIKEKKGTIYPKNKDDKCFQYAATVVLSYGEIKRNSERISNTKPFISKYN